MIPLRTVLDRPSKTAIARSRNQNGVMILSFQKIGRMRRQNTPLLCYHSRPQRLRSIWPAPWIETSGRLQFSVRDSRTSGRSAQSHSFIKMGDQARIDLCHEALNFGLEILNFSDITLREKQYEVFKLLVVEKKDVLAVYPLAMGKV